jgi:phospholipase/carboxylesterase
MDTTQDLLRGPRMEPANGGPAAGLVVLLHCFGADGRQLIPLAGRLQQSLPDVAFVAPHGPVAVAGPTLRGWAEMRIPFDEEDQWEGIVATAPMVDRFVSIERDRRGLSASQIVLVGFSQGAMMALHVGLRRDEAVGAIIGYSGFLVGPGHLDEITVRPPATLIHGNRDPVVSVDTMMKSATALEEVGVPVETIVLPGLGHRVDARGMSAGRTAIQRALGQDA